MTKSTNGATRVSRALRFQILRRDNHACRYCGATAPEAKLTVDHVVAQALGGRNDPSNLVAACQSCNAGKGATPADARIVEDVAQDALRWARARNVAAAQLRGQGDERQAKVVEFGSYFSRRCAECALTIEHLGVGTGPNANQEPSVATWLDRGLTVEDMIYLADEVFARAGHLVERGVPIWRYFAGCCWNRIRQIDDLAQELIAAEEI